MDNASGHTINLANSIIGVSILAMPYCFRQCGILLSIFLLLISSIISRLACHFLLKSAIIARRKTFEFLAFHIFGSLGKFSIEIGMIGFLLGTCIAFFVVMGDLGPEILSEMTGVKIGNALRNSTLVALAVFCVLPLGLLRNVDSLNGVSKATIGFYCCLVLKIVTEALPHIFTGDWVSEVILWRPAGILQCLPIFSMALFCQTQLFEIYQALPNASLEKMNGMVRVAVNMCTWVYIFVGAFGYIAFFQKPFTGNILLSFIPSVASDVIKMGFVLSLAFSFPLVIFPCRASLYSLLYKGTSYTNLHEGGPTNYIPEGKFKMLTLIIVSVSLTIGIMIPSIELVLGLIGSTIGVMICVLFPVTCFICISPKNTNERILAQIMLFVGVIVMVLGTYANIQAIEVANIQAIEVANIQAIEVANLQPITEKAPPPVPEIVKPEPEKPVVMEIPTTIKSAPDEKKQKPPVEAPKQPEPPQPEAPLEKTLNSNEEKLDLKQEDKQGPVVEPVQPPDEKSQKEEVHDKQGPVVEPVQPSEEKNQKEEVQEKQLPVIEPVQPPEEKKQQDVVVPPEQPSNEKKEEIKDTPNEKKKKIEEVDIEAIKKEDTELKEQEDKQQQAQNQILIDTIQKQNEVQKEIVEQHKKLIEVIQRQHEHQEQDKVNEEKVKAVKEIEDIAKRAIESISGQDKKKPEDVNKTLNVEEIKNPEISPKLNMLPLPIALAKLNNATAESTKNKTVLAKSEETEVKAMRREILSEDTTKPRVKRDVSDTKMEKLNEAVKEVCAEMSKSSSTEKPLIKMLCKLSEPSLESVDLAAMKSGNLHDVQPQKRDLKEFSEN